MTAIALPRPASVTRTRRRRSHPDRLAESRMIASRPGSTTVAAAAGSPSTTTKSGDLRERQVFLAPARRASVDRALALAGEQHLGRRVEVDDQIGLRIGRPSTAAVQALRLSGRLGPGHVVGVVVGEEVAVEHHDRAAALRSARRATGGTTPRRSGWPSRSAERADRRSTLEAALDRGLRGAWARAARRCRAAAPRARLIRCATRVVGSARLLESALTPM